MSEATTTPSESTSTPRAALAAADEKKVAAIAAKYDGESWSKWAERYARKVLKVKNGLRSTPAPVPPEMPPAVAKEIREGFLGPDKAKAPKESKPAAKKPAAKKKTAAKKTDAEVVAETTESLADLLP